jgi:hypothetical protein
MDTGQQGDFFVALTARVLSQIQKLDGERFRGEKAVGLSEDAMSFVAEGLFEADTEGIPVVFCHCAGEGEGFDPLVADPEHFSDEGLAIGEAIVAKIEELAEGLVERGVGAAEMFEGAARGEGVEGIGFFDGLEVAAEAREQGTIVGDAEAEGIDGFNGEALGVLEDFPAAALGVGDGFAGDSDAVFVFGAEGAAAGGSLEIAQDAGAHFRRGGAGEGDGEDFFGLVDDGEEAEIAAGEEVGFAGTGGGLNDDGAVDVEGLLARVGVGGQGGKDFSQGNPPHRCRRR